MRMGSMAQGGDGLGWVCGAEYGRTGDEYVGSGTAAVGGVLRVDATVDL